MRDGTVPTLSIPMLSIPALATSALFAWGGCLSAEELADEARDRERAGIAYGTPDVEGEWSNTVYVELWGGGCSGTLISRYHVLTAAHCFFNLDGTDRIALNAWVVLGGDHYTTGVAYPVASHRLHPDYVWTGAPEIHDIAVIVLAAPVAEAAPASVARRGDLPDVDHTVVGFGLDESEDFASVGFRRLATLRSERVEAWYLKDDCDNIPLWGESCVLAGDSGGPWFRPTDLGPVQAAVSVAGELDLESWAVRIEPHYDWLAEALQTGLHCCKSNDVNGDDQVDIFDLSAIAGAYDTYVPWTSLLDLSCDGAVNLPDLALAAGGYGATPRFVCAD